MIYLCWLVEEYPNICEHLVYLSQPLSDDPVFGYTRIYCGEHYDKTPKFEKKKS